MPQLSSPRLSEVACKTSKQTKRKLTSYEIQPETPAELRFQRHVVEWNEQRVGVANGDPEDVGENHKGSHDDCQVGTNSRVHEIQHVGEQPKAKGSPTTYKHY